MATAVNLTRSQCRAETCGAGPPTSLGDAVPNACGTTRCEYAGFNGSLIFTTLVDRSTCGTSPGSGAHALRPWALPWSWTTSRPLLLVVAPLHAALLLLAFL